MELHQATRKYKAFLRPESAGDSHIKKYKDALPGFVLF